MSENNSSANNAEGKPSVSTSPSSVSATNAFLSLLPLNTNRETTGISIIPGISNKDAFNLLHHDSRLNLETLEADTRDITLLINMIASRTNLTPTEEASLVSLRAANAARVETLAALHNFYRNMSEQFGPPIDPGVDAATRTAVTTALRLMYEEVLPGHPLR